MNSFTVNPENSKKFNPYYEIGTDWMLVTSGTKEKFNTMTASWGGVGVLWNKNVSFIFIRPQRYTFEFLENNDYYTLSFFSKEYKSALAQCGRVSGRDVNKIDLTGLTPLFDESAVYFEEARKILVCKKIYSQFIDSNCFIEKDLENNYDNNDYHKMFIGEIVKYIEKD